MKEPDSWLRCGGACCSVSGKAEKISSGLDKQFILYAVTLLESDKRIPGLFRQGQLLCTDRHLSLELHIRVLHAQETPGAGRSPMNNDEGLPEGRKLFWGASKRRSLTIFPCTKSSFPWCCKAVGVAVTTDGAL